MLMLVIGIVIGFVVGCNLYVAHTMTAEEMRRDFVIEQGKLGTICANIFYAPAWVLKVIKAFIK